MLSIGLRDGIRQGLKFNNPFADQCVVAASEILTQVLDKLVRFGCELPLPTHGVLICLFSKSLVAD